MSTTLKITLLCLLAAFSMSAAFKAGETTAAVNHAYALPRKFALEWKFIDETRIWLTAANFDSEAEFAKVGYHPSFTYLVSDYKPIFKKVKDKWQISFTSEIAEGIP